MESEHDYLRRRARQELAQASAARAPARGLHQALAARYTALADAMEPAPPAPGLWARLVGSRDPGGGQPMPSLDTTIR